MATEVKGIMMLNVELLYTLVGVGVIIASFLTAILVVAMFATFVASVVLHLWRSENEKRR